MWLVLGTLVSVAVLAFGQDGPQVLTSQGYVIGSQAVDGEYYEFYGIPYAASTAGSNRFKAPSPPPIFSEPFTANRKNIKCVRALGVGFEGTEDCLTVDVFTPSLDNDRMLPVMVWIKGKELDMMYQQERTFSNFMEQQVVVVSLNFRESIFGFLCLGTETAPGNAGLKDIIAGLRWVHDNIAAFGGDPDDITLFGHGSGAAAVDLVTFSPMANGLVHKAILQSGNAFAPWALSRDSLKYAVLVAEALGHTIDNTEILSEVFSRVSIAALMAVINELDLTDNSLAFAPCLENPNLENGDPFLIKSPYESIDEGDIMQIPFMIGFVEHEGTIRGEEAIGSDWIERMESSFTDFIQPDLKFDTEDQENDVLERIKNVYFADITNIDTNEYLEYHGDTMIVVSSVREARLRSHVSTESVYLYQFSYKGELGEHLVGPSIVDGAAHSEELAYLFSERSNADIPDKDYAVSDILIERWSNFAKTGIPTSETSQVTWLPFSVEDPNYLRFVDHDEISVDDEAGLDTDLKDPHGDIVDFWESIYNEYFLDAQETWTLEDDADQTDLPQVSISQGDVKGSIASDGDYFEFYGIPYADSTSGSHRFKAPSPPPLFKEPFTANRKNIKCVRTLGAGYEGTEDCLVVDIFTPSLEDSRMLPVMVWIKGKEFDTVYQQERHFKKFMEQGVVVVALNFRESVFGFLCLGTETAPGNAGLKDIIAGLRWVQNNIGAFGGDSGDITLFGHGSGAAAVDLITFSPMAEGLVHKAISQSGNAFAPWAVSRENLKYAVQVAEALGHTIDSVETLSEVFSRISVAALMAVINELDLTDNSLAFAPCIENPNLENGDPFLIKSPYESIQEGDIMQIPFMIGFVDHEGTIRVEEAIESDWIEKMESSFTDFIQPDLKFDTEDQENNVLDRIKNVYFADITNIDMNEYLEYHGDTMIVVSSVREARLRSSISTESVYLYQFSYKGELGEHFVGPSIVDSAAHSEELAYLFAFDADVPERDFAVSDILVERWTNFAKTGIPTSEISHVPWLPFSVADPNYLRFLDQDEIVYDEASLEIDLKDPHPEIVNFWDSIYDEHFLDAQGRWTLSERDEDSDDGSGEGEDDGSGEGEDDGSGEGDNEGDCDEDDDDCGEPDSASTAVGYTFLIISLFGILSQFHSQMLL